MHNCVFFLLLISLLCRFLQNGNFSHLFLNRVWLYVNPSFCMTWWTWKVGLKKVMFSTQLSNCNSLGPHSEKIWHSEFANHSFPNMNMHAYQWGVLVKSRFWFIVLVEPEVLCMYSKIPCSTTDAIDLTASHVKKNMFHDCVWVFGVILNQTSLSITFL